MQKAAEDMTSSYASLLESEDMSAEKKQEFIVKMSETQEDIRSSIADNVKKISVGISEITGSVDGVKQAVEKAIEKFPELEEKQKQAESAVEHYRQVVSDGKGELDESTYSDLDEDCNSLEQYISAQKIPDSSVNTVLSMKPVLEGNLVVLNKLAKLKNVTISSGTENLSKLDQIVTSCQASLGSYDIHSLKFDYGDIQTTESAKNPLKTLKEAAGQSILKLIIPDINELSKNKISQGDRLGTKYLGETKEGLSSLLDFIQNMESEEGGQGLFQGLLDNGVKNFDWSSLSSIANVFLVNEYINQHFHNYTSDERKENLALNYELEYILSGHDSDKENLQTVVNKLLLWRTVLNFTSILSDKEKGAEAEAAAAALAGITGVTPLIQAAKTLILIVWSFDESLVDVAALLMNKSISVRKPGKQFQMDFTDLFCINADTIQQKAKQMEEKKTVSLSYEEYINLFLLLSEKQRIYYRTMDLVQENLRRSYNKAFDIENTIYSYEVTGTFQAKYRFLFFPFGIVKEEKDKSFWKVRVSVYGSYV